MANKKYEFTGETITLRGITLHRIRAIVSFSLVHKGDVGGWIEGECNLSDEGSSWVYGDATVCEDAKVYGNAVVRGKAVIMGNAVVMDNAVVGGDAVVSGNAAVYDDAAVSGNARVYDNAMVHGNAEVSGNAEVGGTAVVSGNAVVGYNAVVGGNAVVSGNAVVKDSADYIVFKNCWSSMRWFTYTKSNKKWKVGCFCGTGEELIKKAYADSETIVRAVEAIGGAMREKEVANGNG